MIIHLIIKIELEKIHCASNSFNLHETLFTVHRMLAQTAMVMKFHDFEQVQS